MPVLACQYLPLAFWRVHEGCLDIKPGIMYAGEIHNFMAKKYADFPVRCHPLEIGGP